MFARGGRQGSGPGCWYEQEGWSPYGGGRRAHSGPSRPGVCIIVPRWRDLRNSSAAARPLLRAALGPRHATIRLDLVPAPLQTGARLLSRLMIAMSGLSISRPPPRIVGFRVIGSKQAKTIRADFRGWGCVSVCVAPLCVGTCRVPSVNWQPQGRPWAEWSAA